MRRFFLQAVDVIALVHLLALLPIPFFWLVVHPAVGFWRRFGRRTYWLALPVWGVLGTLLVVERRWVFAGRIQRSGWTWTVGVGLALLAVWLERKRRPELGLRCLVGLPELKLGHPASGVVRSGMYRYLRHPRYLECMLTLLAFAAYTGCAGYFSLAILNVLLYQIVAPLEELELRERYGKAYEDYAREVPRFVPRLWRKSESQISS